MFSTCKQGRKVALLKTAAQPNQNTGVMDNFTIET